MLTSLQHPIIKHVIKLRDNRNYRYENKSVVISGIKQVSELDDLGVVKKIFTLPGYPCDGPKIEVSEAVLKKMTGLITPEPIAAEVAMPPLSNLEGAEKILVIDKIADPGNLGTLLRSALCLGWDGAFILDGSCDPFNEKALRAGKGAAFRLPIGMGNLDKLLALGNYSVYVADPSGKPASTIRKPFMLVLGNESHGATSLQGTPVGIPMSHGFDSLNVAVAGGILMHQLGSL